jgi:hypothetical protein
MAWKAFCASKSRLAARLCLAYSIYREVKRDIVVLTELSSLAICMKSLANRNEQEVDILI